VSSPTSSARRPLRVAQWSTGTIGSRALRALLSTPRLELASLYVHGDTKVGRDAGALCGLR
jgi:4-hydroxy-tetrahydrodipicolinate reductase